MLSSRFRIAALSSVLLLSACSGGSESPPQAKKQYVGPKEIVTRFYAAAAELNCDGAADLAVFRSGDKGRQAFVDDCASSDDFTWAQNVEIGEISPISDDDLADAKSAVTGTADAVVIPVAEGTSPGDPSDKYVLKIDGEWKLYLSGY